MAAPPQFELDCDYSFPDGRGTKPYQPPYVIDPPVYAGFGIAYVPPIGPIYGAGYGWEGYIFLDGGAWSFRDMAGVLPDYWGPFDGSLRDYLGSSSLHNLWNGTYFVMLNVSVSFRTPPYNVILRTTNGEDWGLHVLGGNCLSDNWRLRTATATRDRFLAVATGSGGGIRICESSDGATWTVVSQKTETPYDGVVDQRMAANDDGSEIVFIAYQARTPHVIHVRNREEWIADPFGLSLEPKDIAWGNGVFVMTGEGEDESLAVHMRSLTRPYVLYYRPGRP